MHLYLYFIYMFLYDTFIFYFIFIENNVNPAYKKPGSYTYQGSWDSPRWHFRARVIMVNSAVKNRSKQLE